MLPWPPVGHRLGNELSEHVFLQQIKGYVMKKKELAMFRRMLETELELLLAKAETTVVEMLRSSSDGEPDPLDRATIEYCRNGMYRIRSRESRLIKKIKSSLNAIDDGTYGICQDCEEPIATARLRARPVTSYCLACKSRREAYEKVIGQ
jgi:DnaK suppressor protein